MNTLTDLPDGHLNTLTDLPDGHLKTLTDLPDGHLKDGPSVLPVGAAEQGHVGQEQPLHLHQGTKRTGKGQNQGM
jgi:hypothetical protein